eukprot:6466099-Amphidinium_carterae.1
MFFVLALDPWVRYCCSRMTTPMSMAQPLILYLDDGTVLVQHVDHLRHWEGAFRLLSDELSLELNLTKCVILPLGARSPFEVQRRISEVFPPGHFARRVAISSSTRWLGFALSRGDFQPHTYMVERMEARAQLLEASLLGSAGNSLLGKSAILSMPTHTLRVCSPDEKLSTQWERCTCCHYASASQDVPSASAPSGEGNVWLSDQYPAIATSSAGGATRPNREALF